MHIPSDVIWERMKAEGPGVWLDGSSEPPGFVVVAKMPMRTVRALALGAPIRLRSWAVDVAGKRVAAFGLEVADPHDPLTAYGPCRSVDEIERLRMLLTATGTFSLQVHNEIFLPLLELQCRVDGAPSTTGLGEAQAHDTATRTQAMDAIQARMETGANTVAAVIHDQPTVVSVDNRHHLNSYLAGAGEFRLSDSDQGNELERLVLAAFDHMCPFGAFHQPSVEHNGTRRELCDVLALSREIEHRSEGIFVVQSKALTITKETMTRTGNRRGATVEKHIHDAIGQLSGAIKRLKRGDTVLRKDGTPLQQDPAEAAELVQPIDLVARARNVGHAIVMVSDMHPAIDWEAVATKLFAAAKKTGYLFHVLDMQELQRVVSYSKGRPIVLEANLMRRWQALVKMKSANVRGVPR
jgi:hypothetical protein